MKCSAQVKNAIWFSWKLIYVRKIDFFFDILFSGILKFPQEHVIE